ncbi:Zn-dependent hydrolase [Leptolyngbya sp. 'hensonii']|uniref:Zn-dependent hydrolase n=1 Tax=Leptolyngbya sp. 'hensonii' TaxID=1922337 RepID=UPI0009502A08|nr:Zn-dependent hydrolase [Leptolyngbya sp. 'hensonii']OLP20140.1 Zn-dependent hydrolase [Leptolyngbya sp. 'hensonii']
MSSRLISFPVINRDRLIHSIEELAQIGQIGSGGVRRLAFSAEDICARNLVQHWMTEAGMIVRVDAAGNIIGRSSGLLPEAPALATGSHIDTVPTGGRYDGALGVLAGLEVARVLQEQNLRLNHPFEVIVFSDEESSMIGSKAISGRTVADPTGYVTLEGINIQSCLEQVGGSWGDLHLAQRHRQDMVAFLELHVEQGPMLESLGQEIGVVTGIVGQRRYLITVRGRASHAGSTPMSMRQDAMVAAAQIVLAVNRLANAHGEQVATVGQLQVFPNAANVIPGRVEMSLDIRDLSNDRIDELLNQLQREIATIAAQTGTEIDSQIRLRNEPAPAQEHIQQAIVQVCETLGLGYHHLPSRASHDAQEMAAFTDMGMIFVPSQAGISHSATEYTTPEQCVQGTTVLLHTLLALDQYYAGGR